MTRHNIVQMSWLVATIAAIAVTAGCGGGGGDSGSTVTAPPPPSSVNVAAAYDSLVRKPHTFSLSGSSSQGAQLSMTLSVAQGGSISTPYGTMDVSTTTVALYQGATLVSTNVGTSWLVQGTPYPGITFSSVDGTCLLTTSGTQLPATATVNQSGPLRTATIYAGCNPGNLPLTTWLSSGTQTATWTYAVYNGTPFLCINSTITDIATSTESDCIEVIDANGTLGSHARATLRDRNGVTYNFAN
jgi:hypothetical protein